jgi:phenylpropionate dioxygenase-like ring-hydroxylating dioxygenase large terminal subunit
MDISEQRRIVDRLLSLIGNGTTDLAPQSYERDVLAYYDPARFILERKILFRQTPLWAGFTNDVANPGDFITYDDSGVPILVIRQENGSLSGFVNSCRHRGTRLVDDAFGTLKAIRCPYHGWCYNTSGNLVAVPFRQGFPNMDWATRGLIQVPVAEKYGMIFVRATPGPPIDVAEHLGHLGEELASWNVETAVRVHTKSINSKINWKFALDVFAEGYHFSILHKNTIDKLTYNNVMTYDSFGRHYRLAFPSKQILTLKDKPRDKWVPLDHLSFVYFIFPNISLNVTGAKVPTVRVFRICPGNAVDESITHHTLYSRIPVESVDHRSALIKHFNYMHEVVAREDHKVAVTAQSAVSSGAQSSFIFGRNEPSLIQLHRQFDEAVSHGPTGAMPPAKIP